MTSIGGVVHPLARASSGNGLAGKLKSSFLLFAAFLALAHSLQAATTYYVDYAGGSDTNNGIAKATPFQHAPGMYGCSYTCSSTTPAAGDSIILKGGVTWPTASLGWSWIWSGNATTASPGCTGTGCIYIGVDQTWFAGSSWTRPILNGGGVSVNTPPNGAPNTLLRLYASYVIVDNIEFTGLFWTGVPAFGTGVNIVNAGGTPGIGTNNDLRNLYIHGWTHGTAAAGTSENACGVVGDTAIPNNNVNTILHNSIIDGSDTDKASCSAIFGSPPYIEHNFIRYVSSGLIVNGTVVIDDNTIENVVHSFDNNAHENGIEINAADDVIISNNVIAHLGTGVLGIWCAPDQGYTCYIYNNILYDTDTGNILDLAAPVTNNGCAHGPSYCNSGGSVLVYNNTVECGPDANPAAVCAGIDPAIAAVTLENNHFITNATSPNGGAWLSNGPTPTVRTNLIQTLAGANGEGYTEAEAFPFSPASNGSTIKGGTLISSSTCTGPMLTLCNDSASGVAYAAATHTVNASSRQVNPRPTSGAWDVGAYEFVASTPALVDVSPGAGQQGQSLSVSLTGQATNFKQGTTTVDFGSGVSVTALTVSSSTNISATITIAAGATPGVNSVTVTTGGEIVTAANSFTITTTNPTLTGLSPASGQQGQAHLSVNLTGQFTHFAQGLTTVSFGPQITVNSVSVASPTNITAVITISAPAALGAQDVTITTGTELLTASNAFTVTPGNPVLTAISPASGQAGRTLTVNLTGQFTHFVQGTTTAGFGSAITVINLTVNNEVSATANIVISPFAQVGAVDVTVITGQEHVVAGNGFTVTGFGRDVLQRRPN